MQFTCTYMQQRPLLMPLTVSLTFWSLQKVTCKGRCHSYLLQPALLLGCVVINQIISLASRPCRSQ